MGWNTRITAVSLGRVIELPDPILSPADTILTVEAGVVRTRPESLGFNAGDLARPGILPAEIDISAAPSSDTEAETLVTRLSDRWTMPIPQISGGAAGVDRPGFRSAWDIELYQGSPSLYPVAGQRRIWRRAYLERPRCQLIPQSYRASQPALNRAAEANTDVHFATFVPQQVGAPRPPAPSCAGLQPERATPMHQVQHGRLTFDQELLPVGERQPVATPGLQPLT